MMMILKSLFFFQQRIQCDNKLIGEIIYKLAES